MLGDDQRRVLAMKGKALGRQQLGKIATIAQADTILRWHRELIEPQGDSKPSQNTGRPPMEQEIVDLVLRMGYKREWVEDQKQEYRDWADYTVELIERSEGRMLTSGIGGHFNPPAHNRAEPNK